MSAATDLAAGGFVPIEGRTVVFQIAEGEYRPAQIVKAWGTEPSSAANLIVFLDGSNDTRYPTHGTVSDDEMTMWTTSRVQGEAVGQWLPRKPE